MATSQIQKSRVRRLNPADARDGDYVLYWMQASARAEWNHALELAVQRANELKKRLLVGFGLCEQYPDANARHFAFLLEGLAEVASALARRKIKFVLRRGDPAQVALALGDRAAAIVCDRGYLRHQRAWRREVADQADCEVVQVESDVVVPVEEASAKLETGARTLRPKLAKLRDAYLVELRTTALDKDSRQLSVAGEDASRPQALLEKLDVDRSVPPVGELFRGGARAGRRALRRFLETRLPSYAEGRGEPAEDAVSALSPYLHFGQLSPLQIALAVQARRGVSRESKDAFLEELIVRRELARNWVLYENDYESWQALPGWARETLDAHADDEREHRYTKTELEAAATHDEAWNAAMREMKHTGYCHNHMRMYWGKQILAWTNTPKYARRVAQELNDKYLLDGRDPSSWANVAWLFGVHDRGWPERDVFGKVRSMTRGGLDRKKDVDAYREKVKAQIERLATHRSS